MGTLDFLELRYTVEWPLNIVITEKSIVKYNKVSCSVQQLFFLINRLVRMRGVQEEAVFKILGSLRNDDDNDISQRQKLMI